MNKIDRDIMQLLDVDERTARMIHETMDVEGLVDYSECTQEEFEQAVREGAREVGVPE